MMMEHWTISISPGAKRGELLVAPAVATPLEKGRHREQAGKLALLRDGVTALEFVEAFL
jgi:hypothetical protein